MSVKKVTIQVGENFKLSTQRNGRTQSVKFFNGKYIIDGKQKVPAKYVTLEYAQGVVQPQFYAFGKKYYAVENNNLEEVAPVRVDGGKYLPTIADGEVEIALLQDEGHIVQLNNRPYSRNMKSVFLVVGWGLGIVGLGAIGYAGFRAVVDNLWRFSDFL